MQKTLIILAALALILTACAPGQSPEEVQAQVETAVAMTVSAQEHIAQAVEMTVVAQHPSSTPTQTPTTTPTLNPFPSLTPVIPTATPFVVNPPSGGGGGGGGSSQKADYSCDIIRIRPYAYTEINRGQDFDIKMTVINNGRLAWYQGYDLKYTGGPQMTTTTVIELPAMNPGDEYDVVLDAVAPAEYGNQTMTWMVQGQLCFGYITLTVK